MPLTEAQRQELAKVQRASSSLRAEVASTSVAGPSDLAGQWMQEDVHFDPLPLTAVRSAPRNPMAVAAAPGGSVTVNIKSACLKLHIVDRTTYPVAQVEAEVWSQALGHADDDGFWLSPVFTAGRYALKLRRGAVTAPPCPPHTPVVGLELAQDVDFAGGVVEITITLAINAGALPMMERGKQLLVRAKNQAGGVLAEQLRAFISPWSIGIVTGLLVAWGAGHFVGASEVVDIIAGVIAVIQTGLDIAMALAMAHEIVKFCELATSPVDEFDLQEAGRLLDDLLLQFGVQKLFEILGWVAKRLTGNREPIGKPKPGAEEPTPAKPTEQEPKPAATAEEGGTAAAAAREVSGVMGADLYAARLKAAIEAVERSPVYKRLSPEKLAALRGYTEKFVESELAKSFPQFRFKDYGLGDYAVLNGILRTKDAAGLKKAAAYIAALQDALEAIPSRRTVTFRGVGLNNVALREQILRSAGHFYFDGGFASTSTSLRQAVNFCHRNGGAPELAVLVLNTYSGKPVEWISAHPEEAELLLPAGSRFMIWKRTKEFVTIRTSVGGVLKTEQKTVWFVHLVELRQDLSEFVQVWGRGELLYSTLLELERSMASSSD